MNYINSIKSKQPNKGKTKMNNFTETLIKNLSDLSNKSSFVNVTLQKEIVPGKSGVTKKARSTKEPFESYFTKVIQITSYHANCGGTYETIVNNRLDKTNNEASFKSDGVNWRSKVNNSAIWKHNDKEAYYLELFNTNANWKLGKTTFMSIDKNGNLIPLTKTETDFLTVNFLKVKSSSNKQADAGLTNEEEIQVRTIDIENIVNFKGFGLNVQR